jgi:hypothetical protein
MEAVWQSVQQKAADELIGIECHNLVNLQSWNGWYSR